jgi:nucleotide-binding universal stress UspA family protein
MPKRNRRLVISKLDQSEAFVRFSGMATSTILVPVDFSDVTLRVVEMADRLASAFKSRVVLLYISEPEPEFVGFEPGPVTVRSAVARDFREEHQRLDELKKTFADGLEITALHIQGATVEKILLEAEAQKAELIVMGSHGHGSIYNLLVGSVAEGVLKAAACPVVVVPSAGR